ncbi:sensor histidine kinase [Rhizobium ruizarguesonis]|uniref:sensor histidine kinase n=1 Tax=Rhizobium ruizarguesonis TaxID=2081791 RepID=UPI00371C113E
MLIRNVDHELLVVAISNLLRNAVAHGTPGGPVEVSFTSDGALTIINGGPVLDTDTIAEMMACRKTKPPETRSGLYLVRKVLERLDLTYDVKSPAPGRHDGVGVTIKFPLYYPPLQHPVTAPGRCATTHT